MEIVAKGRSELVATLRVTRRRMEQARDDSSPPPLRPLPPPPRLTRAGLCIAAAMVALSSAFLLSKLPHLSGVAAWWWKERGRWSPPLAGLLVGGVTVLVMLLLLVPNMILTWTTALIFDYACNRGLANREMLVTDGRIMARDILFTTFRSVTREFKYVAAATTLAFLLVAYIFSSTQPVYNDDFA